MSASAGPHQLKAADLPGFIAMIVAVNVGLYAGFAMLVPAGLSLGVGWVLAKVARPANKPMAPASAVQAGHGLWMVLGLAYLGQLDATLIDVAVLLSGAAWLAARPSAVPVSLLACYQAFGLAINGMAFAAATPGTALQKALLVHVCLRAASVVFMVKGLVEIGRPAAAAPAASESGGDEFDLHLEAAPRDRP